MSIIHLAILTVMPTTLLLFVTILPSSHPVGIAMAQNIPFLLWLHCAVSALYFVATLVIITIPMGPTLHFSPARVYSEKMVLSTTNLDRNNVYDVIGASVLDYLLFSHTTKVVMLGYTSESLEIHDVEPSPAPVLSLRIRFEIEHDPLQEQRWGIKQAGRNHPHQYKCHYWKEIHPQ